MTIFGVERNAPDWTRDGDPERRRDEKGETDRNRPRERLRPPLGQDISFARWEPSRVASARTECMLLLSRDCAEYTNA